MEYGNAGISRVENFSLPTGYSEEGTLYTVTFDIRLLNYAVDWDALSPPYTVHFVCAGLGALMASSSATSADVRENKRAVFHTESFSVEPVIELTDQAIARFLGEGNV